MSFSVAGAKWRVAVKTGALSGERANAPLRLSASALGATRLLTSATVSIGLALIYRLARIVGDVADHLLGLVVGLVEHA